MGMVEDDNNKADKANCCRLARLRHRQGMVHRNQGAHSRNQDGRCHRSQILGVVGIHPYRRDTNIELAHQFDKVQDLDFVLA